MKLKTIIVALLLFSIWSCNSETSTEEKVPEVEVKESEWIDVETTAGGYFLSIPIPIPRIAQGEGKIEFSDVSGELDVQAGEYFGYLVYEDESQIKSTIETINNHPFYNVEIVEQTDSTLLYRLFSEQMDKEAWHFYCERSLGIPLLIVSSKQEVEYSEFYTRKMLESALNISSTK